MNELNALLTGEHYREHVAFWKAALARTDSDFRFRANSRPLAPEPGEVLTHDFAIDGDAARSLDGMTRGDDLGSFVVILAAAAHVIRAYQGGSPVIVDSPPLLAGQVATGHDAYIPIVMEVRDEDPVRAHLGRVRDAVAGSYTYQDFPVSREAEILLKRPRPTTNVAARFDGLHRETPAPGMYDLSIVLTRADGLRVRLCSRAAAFSSHFLGHFAGHLKNALARYAQADVPLGQVSLLDDAERRRYLLGTSSTEAPPPGDRTVVDLFRGRARAPGDNIALVADDATVTYEALNERSNRLAHFLRDEYGVGRGDVVAVFPERSELWIVAMLAVLKAGGVYLPLDPQYPEERIRFAVEDAGAKALLVHSDHLPALASLYETPMFALDFQLDALEAPATDPSFAPGPDDPAYLIYTSGSTGKPKGVVVGHLGLANMVTHHIEAFGIDETDRLSQFYAASFDSSLFEVMVALLSGARLVLASTETIKDHALFSDLVEREGITTITAPPIYLGMLDARKLGPVRRIISAGDHAKVDVAKGLARGRAYFNSYGPTETTVCVTHHKVDPSAAYGSRIPIGRPIRNMTIYLLDDRLNLVPEGGIGEICVAGVGLAQGYLNRREATDAAFVPNPHAPGTRLYRTGDLGTWTPEGELDLIGRKDTQVKVRGYRIELGEIEAALARHEAVREAVVLAREDEAGSKRLVAYVSSDADPTAAGLRESLGERLPEFMIPSAFVVLRAMPLTPNGKIDRKALPDPQATAMGPTSAYAPPEDATQSRLATIWGEVLGLDRVGIHDNFFELGGDSILILQVVSRAARAGLRLSPQQLFENQTVAALAAVAVDLRPSFADQVPVSGPAPLTPIQRWFFSRPLAQRHHFNQSVTVEVPDRLGPDVVGRALGAVVDHHDALRLRFAEEGGRWRQWHEPQAGELPCGSTDLTGLSGPEAEAAVLEEASRLQASFDLSRGPLVRPHLFRYDEGRPSRLLLIAHHLVIDGVSWRILLEDLASACEQLGNGDPVRLPAKSTSFQEWARRLEALGRTEVEGRESWYKQAQQDSAAIPRDFEADPGANTMGSAAELTTTLDVNHTQRLLQEAAQAYNAQINDILLATLLLASREWTGRPSLLVDLEGHGREDLFEDVELSRTIGWFTALFPVRLEAAEGAGPVDALKAVKERLRAVPLRGLGYGLERYPRDAEEVPNPLASGPRAEILFNYLGQTDRVLAAGTGWRPVLGITGPEQGEANRRSHVLEVTGMIFEGQLRMTWVYSERVHRQATIEGIANRHQELLAALIDECRSSASRAYTPSDFPGARVDQETLDALTAAIEP